LLSKVIKDLRLQIELVLDLKVLLKDHINGFNQLLLSSIGATPFLFEIDPVLMSFVLHENLLDLFNEILFHLGTRHLPEIKAEWLLILN
jgi:hypothetical protein